MVVGIAQFELFMPYNHSLKEKRQVLRKLKERVAAKFKLNISEVDFQDKWQRASLAFSLVGQEEKVLDSVITRTLNFIEAMGLGEIASEFRDMIHYE